MIDGPVFTLDRGTTPLLVSLLPVGTHIPADLRPAFEARALSVRALGQATLAWKPA